MRVRDRFILGRKIGAGSFGELYHGVDSQTGREVAVKFESIKIRRPQVIEEAKFLKELNGELGFPRFIWFGRDGPYNIMVIAMLGPSIEDLFNFCGRKISLKTVLFLADQLIQRIEQMHKRGYIHRDLKPENILMGLQGHDASTLHLIDFGLTKKW